jgi:hypothetical protein
VSTFRLLFGEQLAIGTASELAVYIILHRLVETYIPYRLAIRTELTSISWKGVKTIVQYVLVTPSELSLQVRLRFFNTPE